MIRILCLCCIWVVHPVAAQTQIYKCTDPDGGVSYSQLPCPPPAPEESEQSDPIEDAESEHVELDELNSPPKATGTQAECRKQIRDQIDAIDAEIGRNYSPDKAEDYKQRLLALTRELREC